MTPAEARLELQLPLVFGKPEQLLAVKVLEAIELCVNAILGCTHNHAETGKCSNCSRTGECTCLDCGTFHTCGKCGGKGKIQMRCSCYSVFASEVLEEALKDRRISFELQEKIEELEEEGV